MWRERERNPFGKTTLWSAASTCTATAQPDVRQQTEGRFQPQRKENLFLLSPLSLFQNRARMRESSSPARHWGRRDGRRLKGGCISSTSSLLSMERKNRIFPLEFLHNDARLFCTVGVISYTTKVLIGRELRPNWRHANEVPHRRWWWLMSKMCRWVTTLSSMISVQQRIMTIL